MLCLCILDKPGWKAANEAHANANDYSGIATYIALRRRHLYVLHSSMSPLIKRESGRQ